MGGWIYDLVLPTFGVRQDFLEVRTWGFDLGCGASRQFL